MKKRSLSVILPAFNEEGSLVSCTDQLIRILKSYISEYQVIIINDGSTDNTLAVAKELAQKYSSVEVLDNVINLGIGKSYKNALSHVNCEYVTWLPTDGEIDPSELIKTFTHINKYHCIGTYPINSLEVRSLFRYYLSKIYQWLFRILFISDVKYFNGVTLFRTKYLKEIAIVSDGFSFTGESVIKFLSTYRELENFFIQVPIRLTPRESGRATAIRLSVLINIIWFIVIMKKSHGSRIKINVADKKNLLK